MQYRPKERDPDLRPMATSKAEAVEADEPAAPAPKPPPASKKGGALVLIGAVVLSVGASAGVSWYFSHQALAALKATAATDAAVDEAPKEPEAKKDPPLYQTMEPALVVNLDDPTGLRFLQVQLELMARDKDALEAVSRYNPRIRNALLLLLGQQQVPDLTTREGKERLQAAVLAEIQKVLQEETGKPGVEAVYFSTFVMQ